MDCLSLFLRNLCFLNSFNNLISQFNGYNEESDYSVSWNYSARRL